MDNLFEDNNEAIHDVAEIMKLCATNPDIAMQAAAENGDIEIVNLCKIFGAIDYDTAMSWAAGGGHIEIVKLCKEWGATDYNEAMHDAAYNGYINIVKLCKEWGATDYEETMDYATSNGHIEIVLLCRSWLGYDAIHNELFRQHHKHRFHRKIHEELLSIAWHPDKWWDWCVDEEEKQVAENLWC